MDPIRELLMRNNVPSFGERQWTIAPNECGVEIVTALVGSRELKVLNGTKPLPEGRVLGHTAVARVISVPAGETSVEEGQYVLVRSRVPCGRCSSCARRHWEGCDNPQVLGEDRDGVFAQRLSIPSTALVALPQDADPTLNLNVFLAHGQVAKGMWLATQEFASKTNHIGLVGRAAVVELLATVLEDLGQVSVERVVNRSLSYYPQRFDVLIDCDGETSTPQDLARAVRPGGLVVSDYTPVQMALFSRIWAQHGVRAVPYLFAPTLLAVQWIAQNLDCFEEFGLGFSFDGQGLAQILAHEGVRETKGLFYFEFRPDQYAPEALQEAIERGNGEVVEESVGS